MDGLVGAKVVHVAFEIIGVGGFAVGGELEDGAAVVGAEGGVVEGEEIGAGAVEDSVNGEFLGGGGFRRRGLWP